MAIESVIPELDPTTITPIGHELPSASEQHVNSSVARGMDVMSGNLVYGGNDLVDRFLHWSGAPGDEGSDKMLPLAWRTHAAGYLRTGLATQAAVNDGLLSPVIDKSRHLQTGVTYYLATNPEDHGERSTARLIDAEQIEALPTYTLTGGSISEEGNERLREAIDSGRGLQEIGALANSLHGYCRGSTEILRRIVIDNLASGEGKLLFCSMVDRARAGLIHSLAPANLQTIGEPTVLEANEYRKETTLIPVVIDPSRLVKNIFDAFLTARTSSQQRRLLESTLFYAEPLAEEFVPDEVRELRMRLGRNMIRPVVTEEGI